jgi:thiol-disulfide isomerase/thioredoxin
MLHVNWCATCKRTLPELKKAAELNMKKNQIVFAEIDVTDHSDFSHSLQVNAFPALRVLPRGANPSTLFADWIHIPYYFRNANSILDFLNRVISPDFVDIQDRETLIAAVNAPDHYIQYHQSLVVSGITEGINDLKLKFNVIRTNSSLIESAFSVSCPNTDACAVVVPSKRAVVLPLLPPVFDASKGSIEEWVSRNAFPGLWIVDEGAMFYSFNDQSVFKVLIAQDPANGMNETIVNAFGKCGKEFSGKASFGLINGVSFSQALSDFGVSLESGAIAVLVLTDKPMDFTRFFSDVRIESLCEDLRGAIDGKMEMRFRGSWLTKLHAILPTDLTGIACAAGIALLLGCACCSRRKQDAKKDL